MPDQGITQPYIETYLDGLLPERDAILKRLEREAAEEGWPIIGPLVGQPDISADVQVGQRGDPLCNHEVHYHRPGGPG